jgi:hypothetical protein
MMKSYTLHIFISIQINYYKQYKIDIITQTNHLKSKHQYLYQSFINNNGVFAF